MGAGVNALQDAQICRLMHSDWSKACYLEGAAQMLLKVNIPVHIVLLPPYLPACIDEMLLDPLYSGL